MTPGSSGEARTAFEALFTAHYTELLRFAEARVDAESARDAVAEVFTTAWRRWAALPDAPRPWLYGIALGVLANHIRAGKRRDRLHQRLAEARQRPVGVEQSDPDAPVLRALAALSDRDRLVLRLTEWDELDPASAAAVCGCSVGAYNVRLHRARRRLATALNALHPDPGSRPELKETRR